MELELWKWKFINYSIHYQGFKKWEDNEMGKLWNLMNLFKKSWIVIILNKTNFPRERGWLIQRQEDKGNNIL